MRTKPYNEIGIKRKKCFRSGEQAEFQWQICSDGNQYRPICKQCDVALVLDFMGFKDKDIKIANYIKELR